MKTLRLLFAVLHSARNEFGASNDVEHDIKLAIESAAFATANNYKPRTRKIAINAAERKMASEGMKINAIKSLRDRTNLSLKEAKDMVEAWMTANGYPLYTFTPNTYATPDEPLNYYEQEAAKNNKINAIKMYKERTGYSLMESKLAVEKWLYENSRL